MTYTVTPLGLQLPVPGSGQAFSTAVYNANLTKLDAAITALQAAAGTPVAGTIAARSGFSRGGDTFLQRTPGGYVSGYMFFTGTFRDALTDQFATFPAGFRPTTPKLWPAMFGGNTYPRSGGVQLEPDGTVTSFNGNGAHQTVGLLFGFQLGT